jgi:polyisoprenoid-binding protein YceI
MTNTVRTTRWMVAALLPLLFGARGAFTVMDPLPESRVWVGGTSSVRGWECKATTFTLNVESGDNAAAGVLAGEKLVNAAGLAIPVEKLECGNGTMNGHMKKALKMAEHPEITFRLTTYELTRSDDSVSVALSGLLNLGGTEKPIELVAMAAPAADGALRVTGTYALKMTDFGLKPPTLMFGTMKVHDQVKVGFDIVLKDRAN